MLETEERERALHDTRSITLVLLQREDEKLLAPVAHVFPATQMIEIEESGEFVESVGAAATRRRDSVGCGYAASEIRGAPNFTHSELVKVAAGPRAPLGGRVLSPVEPVSRLLRVDRIAQHDDQLERAPVFKKRL